MSLLDGFSDESIRATAARAAEEAAHKWRCQDAVIAAARKFPRETPKSGGAATLHDFKIPAAVVWELDAALKALDAAR